MRRFLEDFLPYFLGIILGLILLTVVINADKHEHLIDECEANLPRNEHCVLIAVPQKLELQQKTTEF